MNRIARHLLILGALLLALPAPAFATADQVVRDCARDGRLDGDYSNAELRRARDNLPADADEYSDCRDVIANAIHGESGGGLGSPGVADINPSGEVTAQVEDQADLAAITSGEDPGNLDVGGTSLEPDSSGFFGLGGAANTVPAPLLVALLLLGGMALTSGFGAVRERVPALARVPLLSKLPTPRVPFFGRRG
jgi:hypothetical protein